MSNTQSKNNLFTLPTLYSIGENKKYLDLPNDTEEKVKVGRPTKEKDEKKIAVPGGFTPNEKKRIEAVAKNKGYSVSSFIRIPGLKLLDEWE